MCTVGKEEGAAGWEERKEGSSAVVGTVAAAPEGATAEATAAVSVGVTAEVETAAAAPEGATAEATAAVPEGTLAEVETAAAAPEAATAEATEAVPEGTPAGATAVLQVGGTEGSQEAICCQCRAVPTREVRSRWDRRDTRKIQRTR